MGGFIHNRWERKEGRAAYGAVWQGKKSGGDGHARQFTYYCQNLYHFAVWLPRALAQLKYEFQTPADKAKYGTRMVDGTK